MDSKTYRELSELYSDVYKKEETSVEDLEEQGGQNRMRQLIQKNQRASADAGRSWKPTGVPTGASRRSARRSGSDPSGGAAKPAPSGGAAKPAPSGGAAKPAPSGGSGGGGRPAPSGGSGGGSAPSGGAAKPAPKPFVKQTGDKAKDMATWAAGNKKLAAAKAERDRTRGTSATTNPLMKDFKSKLPAPKPLNAKAAGQGSAAKQSKTEDLFAHTEYDAFDLVMEHLLDQGFDQNEAIELMITMSEEKRQAIIEARRSEKEGKGSSEMRMSFGGKDYLVGARGDRKKKGEAGGRHQYSGGESGSRRERGVSGSTQKRVYADHGTSRVEKLKKAKANISSPRD